MKFSDFPNISLKLFGNSYRNSYNSCNLSKNDSIAGVFEKFLRTALLKNNDQLKNSMCEVTVRLKFTCSKTTRETLEKGVKHVQNQS